ncbi:MAG: C39 family peptidase [Methanoregula sp.]|jgi:hypothetical protein|nr:C39 family peptidase [Methanoregula sp.]
MTQLKKTGVVLLLLLVAGMAIVPCVSAADLSENNNQFGTVNGESKNPSDDVTIVEISDAESIAILNAKDLAITVPDFADWKNSAVKHSKTYYDLNDQEAAYVFDVRVDGEYAGYILISATTGNYPVLEITKGRLPGYNEAMTPDTEKSVEKFASEKGLTITESKPVYLGSLSYYRKYSMVNQNGVKASDVLVDEHTNQVVKDAKSTVIDQETPDSELTEKMQADKKADIKAQWDKQRILISDTDSKERTALLNSIQATKSSGYVYGVPLFKQVSDVYDGCSPMASSMVVGYWSTHGYPALPSARATLFTQLASAMGTSNWPWTGTTWPWDIDDGINTVFYTYTLKSPAANDYFPGWSGFVSEINAGRPFVLNMLNGGISVGGSQAYGDHSVAVVGYVTSINNFVTIHDTWDDTNYHLLQDGSWNNIMTTWVRP